MYCLVEYQQHRVLRQTRSQQGTVLIVSLLILLAMTALGLAATSGANLELRMASNNQDINATLQAAESAVVASAGNINLMGQALSSNAPVTQSIRLDSNYNAASQPVKSVAEVTYMGTGVLDGYSIGVGQSGFVSYNFEAKGTGIKQGTVTSVTSEGMYRIMSGGG
jgi:type IV pilus assembly protein PilX